MEVITDIPTWQAIRNNLAPNLNLGFVATMGALHRGHQSLIERSVKENDISILSIFVNPTQFNNKEDYTNYPITAENDLSLTKALKVDYVLMFTKEDLYPDNYLTKVTTEHPLSKVMEGAYRPGHFNGVLTIVMKLLLLARANRAYFGEKDYQQYKLIDSMVKAFFIDTKIVPCPIIRETDSNLALSSRNLRLNKEQKHLAESFADIFKANKNNPTLIKEKLEKLEIDIDYIEQYQGRLLAAITIDTIRLIDNLEV